MSWPKVRLGEVLRHRKNFIMIDDLSIYKRARVQLHTQGIVVRDVVPGAMIKTKRQQACRAGEFLVAEIDAKVGGFGIVPESLDDGIVSSHYFLYEIDESKLDRRFLDFFIRTHTFRDQVEAQGSTNYAAIRPADVLGYLIPLPPLAEQRRVVARVSEIAEQIQEASLLRVIAINESEALRAASVRPVFSSSWPLIRLEDVCSVITDGTHQTPSYTESGSMFLSAQNIKPFRFMPGNHRKVSFADFKNYTIRNKPKQGDVLLTRVGAGIGEAAVVDQDVEFAIYVSLALIRTNTERLLPEYLVHWLNSPIGREWSRKETLGKGHSQGNLNLKLMRGFLIPVPSISIQENAVNTLNKIYTEINGLRQLQDQGLDELGAMLPAILNQVFAGQF